jgi:hypothetical protein
MSILLNSIDCPCLTNDCLDNLVEHYSIRTTNDFALWLTKSIDRNKYFSSSTIECIQSCLIAHIGIISNRKIFNLNRNSYKIDNLFFDNDHLLTCKRHLIFIYEYFNQNQWNKFFNIFLLRLFLQNESIKIKYINTNISLFDLNYFYHYYCSLNEKISCQRNHLFENLFDFNQCFDLETFENELNFIENNPHSLHILIIDDLLSLIKPYLGLDRRMKGKILQLTYRLNRLAQKQSILIINGIILHTKKRLKNQVSVIDDIRLDSFHADKYILFQSLMPREKDIHVKIISNQNKDKHSVTSIIDLDQWTDIKNGKFYLFSTELVRSEREFCVSGLDF